MKRPLIIAEAGNNHEGNIEVALQLIELAKECGVDMIKFQAGHAVDFARKKWQIPLYEKYDLGSEGYKKLLFYGNELNIPVFFSIWSEDYEFLWRFEQYHKLPSRQFSERRLLWYDVPNAFISIPYRTARIRSYGIKDAICMHCVTQYPAKNPHLEYIPFMQKYVGRPVGYSDHTIGINSCINAVKQYGAIAIEKHFTVAHDFGPLRDHVLSATPGQMKNLVRTIKGD